MGKAIFGLEVESPMSLAHKAGKTQLPTKAFFSKKHLSGHRDFQAPSLDLTQNLHTELGKCRNMPHTRMHAAHLQIAKMRNIRQKSHLQSATRSNCTLLTSIFGECPERNAKKVTFGPAEL